MPRVVAIMNQKGGVGKTTTALNLGAALAHRGQRVLLVDLDPQANLTLGLGKRAADLSESVYELLTTPKPDAARLIVHTQWPNLDLLPSHIDLSGAEIEMVSMIGRETRLARALEPVRENYDYILIDCLPSLSLLTVNAMVAATEVFVPLQAHPFALEGLGKLFEVVGMIRDAMNPKLRVTGVLVTMFDVRTNVSKVTLDALRRDARLCDFIFTTTIKQNIRVAESQKDGIPVVHFDAACHASRAYFALAAEVIEMAAGAKACECAARITEREKHSGHRYRTFTPDLIAPPTEVQNTKPKPQSSAPAEVVGTQSTSDVQAEPTTVAVLQSGAAAPAPEPVVAPVAEANVAEPPAAPPVEAAPVIEQAEMPVVAVVETPAAQAAPMPVAEPVAVVAPGAEPVAVAAEVVAAPTAPAGEIPDLSDEDQFYRPRLALRPGSCKIPLPPA